MSYWPGYDLEHATKPSFPNLDYTNSAYVGSCFSDLELNSVVRLLSNKFLISISSAALVSCKIKGHIKTGLSDCLKIRSDHTRRHLQPILNLALSHVYMKLCKHVCMMHAQCLYVLHMLVYSYANQLCTGLHTIINSVTQIYQRLLKS